MVTLFSWGANSYGQLGVGHTDDKLLPVRVELESCEVKQISGGGGHTIVLTTDGKIFVFGWNKMGQCGVPPSDPSCHTLPLPRSLPGLSWKVQKVACGWNHTLALVEGGKITTWGSNAFGQLGIPSVEKMTSTLTELSSEALHDCHVTDISAGLRHSLAVTGDRKLFAWGDGKKGQLGLGAQELSVHKEPRHVVLGDCSDCKAVSAGAYHSAGLTTDGTLLLWGLNQHGQCGVSRLPLDPESSPRQCDVKLTPPGLIANVYVPVRMRGVATIAEVCCGWSHTIAITAEERRVYGWGRADYGQLGQHLISGQGAVQDAAAGHSSTGQSVSGQGVVEQSTTGQSVAGQSVAGQGVAGQSSTGHNTAEQSTTGQNTAGQYVAGQSTTGQSATNTTDNVVQCWSSTPLEIVQLKGVQQIACGSEHNLALTGSGKVLAFGWNEHGMCATGDEENVWGPREVSGLPEGGVASLVGAGAGHSLIIHVDGHK